MALKRINKELTDLGRYVRSCTKILRDGLGHDKIKPDKVVLDV
jgi:hypothetical protein